MKSLLVGIDDSRINQVIFEEAAKFLDMDVIVAEDGVDGFDKINNTVNEGRVPTVIITDINMPNMNGLELIEKLKANMPTRFIPILVLSTERDYSMKVQGKNLGAAGWITKPMSPEDVANIVKKFLKK
jgi:two-component system chemotaxis response regulator CheY